MLFDKLSDYLSDVESTIYSRQDCHIEKYEEEVLSPNRANLLIRVRFSNGSLLELNEAITIENLSLKYLSYRYHFQDKTNKLLFRYDNTPHFPKLITFPHHKHLADKVVPVKQPSLTAVIAEVTKLLATYQ